jgi:Kyakuja-Dileera-Zisupton transposase
MMYLAGDGNCKMSEFHKNSSHSDLSFYRGKSYFPPLSEYMKFLAEAKKSGFAVSSSQLFSCDIWLKFREQKTSSECGHIKVINRQLQQATKSVVPKKKVGVVNTACSHVFILSTTDMYGAEKCAPSILSTAVTDNLFLTVKRTLMPLSHMCIIFMATGMVCKRITDI